MIFAAGRGERLRPLTDATPKPLIEIAGETLIDRHLDRLLAAGIDEVVVNLAHLGARIEQHLGARSAPRVKFSREPEGALETAGGIVQALPLLGGDPFLVVNGDVWCDFDFARLRAVTGPAHLVVVDNPPHHPDGDFCAIDGRLSRALPRPLTYAGIGVFAPALFAGLAPGRRALGPLLFELAAAGRLTGEYFAGRWFDIGTRERLDAARAAIGGG